MSAKPSDAVNTRVQKLTSAEYHHPFADSPTRYSLADLVRPNSEWRQLERDNPFLSRLPYKTYHITAITKLTYHTPNGKIQTTVATLDGKEELALQYLKHVTIDDTLDKWPETPEPTAQEPLHSNSESPLPTPEAETEALQHQLPEPAPHPAP